MVIFKTFTSLTPKQILKTGLIFSFLSSVLLVANASVPQAYFTSLASILRLIVYLISVTFVYTLVTYVAAYFCAPFAFAYELLSKRTSLAWPIFRPLTPLDIILFAMVLLGVFFALSLKNYLGRERRTWIWWLAAWMTISFFLVPWYSLLQSNEPQTPTKTKEVTSSQTYDGHYAGPNDSYLDVKTDAAGVVTISGQAYWYSDKTANTGVISGPIAIANGQALYKDGQCLIDLAFTNAAIVAKEQAGSICGGLNVSFDGKYTKEELAIQLLSTEIPAGSYDFVEGGKTMCQPEFFDPKITKFHKVEQDGSPSIMYQLNDEEYTHFMINGWRNEGEDKITLPAPYDLNFYEFGCASSFSYVLELTKNDQREALYTHVGNFGVSEDKKYLYLANNVKSADGKWEKLRRIINIESQKTIKLPNMDCVSGLGFWDGTTLITYSNEQEYTSGETKTKVCFWSIEGNLRSQLEAPLDWGAGAGYYLDSPMGLLPKDNDIFYAFVPKFKDNKCHLVLQDLKNALRHKEIEIIDRDPHCPRVDFDFNNLSFESKTVRFRLQDCSYDYASPSGVEKCNWKEWQVAEAVEK